MEATDVARLRQALSLTQEQFAQRLGVTVSTVNRWEAGHVRLSPLARLTLLRLVEDEPALRRQERRV